jgi:diketogulonate reductase-like aldo/keto reductase
MQKRHFGPLPDLVPVIGIGTWNMEQVPRDRAVSAIRKAIDIGMTHIDTAELYGRGAVEELVGEAIVGRRAEVFLTSKLMPSHGTYAGTILACEKTLSRLRTDHLDLYLLHWPESMPLEDTWRAMETLRNEGKIRAWGVSNFDVVDLERAIEMVGEGKIACNQVLYNLLERDVEHVLLPFCERKKIAVTGYSPFGTGDFSRMGGWRLDVLTRIGSAHGTTARAVALRFLVRRPSLFTIPKSTDLTHLEENAEAGDLVLSDDELHEIMHAFPCGEPKSKMPFV